jgi:hypothetical protein
MRVFTVIRYILLKIKFLVFVEVEMFRLRQIQARTPHNHKFPYTDFTLKAWNIPFANHMKYLGVTFDGKITWKVHVENVEDKTFRTFIRV